MLYMEANVPKMTSGSITGRAVKNQHKVEPKTNKQVNFGPLNYELLIKL